MKNTIFRMAAILLAVLLLPSVLSLASFADGAVPTEENTGAATEFGVADGSLELDCKSAILMEATTGAVLYMQNPDEALPPASVTKIMTLLLVMEEIDSGRIRLDETVSVSANAASMGGSQVYLKEGEVMTVEDLLKSVVIASANDAAVALAERVAGSVSVFVERMNAKAKLLGMTSTTFENVTGLDDTAKNHLTSARDIALMSQELLKHPTVLQYSSIWMDTIRDGAFGLTNTNRLVRFYKGCTGLKTGSTSKAGFCVSVTAERDGFSLICVIMGAESGDTRNAAASTLLDWGFANYGLYTAKKGSLAPIPVTGGSEDACFAEYGAFAKVLPRDQASSVTAKVTIPESVAAPVKRGDVLGKIEYTLNGRVIGSVAICASRDVTRINFFEIFGRILAKFLLI
ncbi:MAG: D-alanyl-D-alanine carboxypeptidase [Clostridia bacterium]|nr:D-alanyl-D-alanine carboxypeptidase [Clostridia bacterium]